MGVVTGILIFLIFLWIVMAICGLISGFFGWLDAGARARQEAAEAKKQAERAARRERARQVKHRKWVEEMRRLEREGHFRITYIAE